MNSINGINYEGNEDLKIYFDDNFRTTETIEDIETGSATTEVRVTELIHETGSTQSSISETYYNLNIFNPVYASAIYKVYLSSMENVFTFFGFKETIAEPTFAMTESHSGIMCYNGKMYVSVADGYTQQRIEIPTIDMTEVKQYKIEFNKFYMQPLPQIEEILGIPNILSVNRIWGLVAECNSYPPINQVHYLVNYIKNSVNSTKRMTINRFIYKEVYAD